jgi:hypothetical protein
MSRNTMLRVSLAVIMMIGVATACTKEQRQEIVDDTVEVAARNVASEGGRSSSRSPISMSMGTWTASPTPRPTPRRSP